MQILIYQYDFVDVLKFLNPKLEEKDENFQVWSSLILMPFSEEIFFFDPEQDYHS